MPCDQRRVGGRGGDQLEAETFVIVKSKPAFLANRFDARGRKSPCPEVERLVRADAKSDPVDHPGPRAAAHQTWILEEGEIRAWAAVLVGIEEVVDRRVVLVDRLLHQAHAHEAGVEAE